MSQLQLNLVESEVKIVLEALSDMENKLIKNCELLEENCDVSESADNLVEVRLLLGPLKEKAIKKFGTVVTKRACSS